MRLLTKLSLILPLFLSCNDQALIEKNIGPRALVYPEYLNFGHVNVGENLQEYGSTISYDTFIVVNTGDEDLLISELNLLDIVGNSNAISIENGDIEHPILPGENRVFLVSFEPENYEIDSAKIQILTNAEATNSDQNYGAELVVEVFGIGDAPNILIDPNDIDFGNLTVNCDSTETVTITNSGNIDLHIYGLDETISTTFPGNFVVNYGTLSAPTNDNPWVIPASQSLDFFVNFESDLAFINSSSHFDIRVYSDDLESPIEIILVEGYNEVETPIIDNFVTEETKKTDVIIVIDDSGSMLRFQNLLHNEIPVFVTELENLEIEYNIAVLTTTPGRWIGMVSHSDINPHQILSGFTQVGLGGIGNESGLDSVYVCLINGYCAPGNSSFWRNDADLVLVFVSDEPDQSPNPWTWYETEYTQIKPIDKIQIYSIVGDVPDGCYSYINGTPYSAVAGYGYWDLALSLGGTNYSICQPNWNILMRTLSSSVSSSMRYLLSQDGTQIIPGTLEVFVNGQLQDSSYYEYRENINSIVFFDGYGPDPGDTIDIKYSVGSCN